MATFGEKEYSAHMFREARKQQARRRSQVSKVRALIAGVALFAVIVVIIYVNTSVAASSEHQDSSELSASVFGSAIKDAANALAQQDLATASDTINDFSDRTKSDELLNTNVQADIPINHYAQLDFPASATASQSTLAYEQTGSDNLNSQSNSSTYMGASGLTFIGGGAHGAASSPTIVDLYDCIDDISEGGYSLSFVLYDLSNGQGLAYNADTLFYSASSIKAPYCTSLVAAQPKTLYDNYDLMYTALAYSNNVAYDSLIQNYGFNSIYSFCDDAGITIDERNPMYPFISARDLAKLWVRSWEFLGSDATEANDLAELLAAPNYSAIFPALGWLYPTFTKAGWFYDGAIDDELGWEDITVQTEPCSVDAGVVYASGHPYIMILMSDIPGSLESLEPLAIALDNVHDELVR
ncbi:MAG: serine hydrolase [Coriobacteriales bacterium]|jgi:hypothetical protein|nr:serine hydrolase [Coriobacteriales bacterium]